MSGWDEGGVFYHNPNGGEMEGDSENANPTIATEKFLKFIRNFLHRNAYTYRDQLRQRVNQSQFFLEVNMDDLRSFDEALADDLISNPNDFMPWFENAAKEAVILMKGQKNVADVDINIQIILRSSANHTPIRSLKATNISRLVKIPGIVISASRIQSKATHIRMVCRSCQLVKDMSVKAGFQNITFPKICDPASKCPPNSFFVVADECRFVDQQTLKLQEAPEEVPTGEMPRNLALTIDRALVGRAVPGTRLVAIGVYTVMNSLGGRGGGDKGNTVRTAYLRVLGLESNEGSGGRVGAVFTAEEEREFRQLARTHDIHSYIANNIAPAIYGHEQIKRAIACQLMGGAMKHLPDRMRLRGDINLLLLGDPGTAKSQLLKFVEKVAPIGVYTSGKGSSAAGLTASVIRDSTSREFYLEGGAMVLADGGVVCIDEFDKMNPNDRVAIHEAMEQQTISVAKAGITTILNSRTAVLAAANPVFGRYDEQRDAGENIDFKSTILSRFDLIFIVKDHRNEARDKLIAEHVIGLHMKGNVTHDAAVGDIDLPKLKRYIAFCRARCSPRLSAEGAGVLQNYYVSVRSTVRQREIEGAPTSVPVTVRQLEAIVRLSESIAKMSLSDVATERHVEEAIRLFNISTYEAVTSGVLSSENISPTVFQDVQSAEKLLKRRLPIGSHTSERAIVEDFVKQGLNEFAVRKAIEIMVRRDELEYRHQRKKIYRKR